MTGKWALYCGVSRSCRRSFSRSFCLRLTRKSLLSESSSLGCCFALILGESTHALCTHLDLDASSAEVDVVLLQVWLPNLGSFALRERDVVSELLAFITDVACV